MDFQIMTDSCCDFTDAQYTRLCVTYVPLTVMWDGQAHSHFGDEAALRTRIWSPSPTATAPRTPLPWKPS